MTAQPAWVLDLNRTPSTHPKTNTLPDPPGWTGRLTSSTNKSKSQSITKDHKAPTTEEIDTLKMKKAWEIAIGPAKQLPMNAIGMYMSGNSLQIFSLMMVFMLFKTPLSQIMSTQQTFARFETEGNKSRILGVKLVFIAMNLLLVGLGIWKINGMGLLP